MRRFLNDAPGGKLFDGCLIGHNGSYPVGDILLDQNYGWAPTLSDRDVRLGWSAPHNRDATLTNNYLVGQTIFQTEWESISLAGNTFIGSVTGVDPGSHPGNTYLAEPPVKNHVAVRWNRYQPGPAHIIVYNWERLDAVEVDLSDLVPSGTPFVLRNVQDYYGAPVVSGTYQGSVTIPMNDLVVAPPLGETEPVAQEWRTGKDFNVFVLEAAVCDQTGGAD